MDWLSGLLIASRWLWNERESNACHLLNRSELGFTIIAYIAALGRDREWSIWIPWSLIFSRLINAPKDSGLKAKSLVGPILTRQNCIHDEFRSYLNEGNACHHSVQNFLSFRFLSTNINVKIHFTIILPVLCVFNFVSHIRQETGTRCLRIGRWGRYFSLKEWVNRGMEKIA